MGSIDLIDTASIYVNTGTTTYTGKISEFNKALKSLNLNVPLGYSGEVSIILSVSDGEFTEVRSVELQADMPEIGPNLDIADGIELFEDSSSVLKHVKVVGGSISDTEMVDFTIFASNGHVSHGEDADTVRQLNSSTIQGFPDDVNRVLKDAQYIPNANFVGIDFINV